jgi:TorA maturation chaperone TorD
MENSGIPNDSNSTDLNNLAKSENISIAKTQAKLYGFAGNVFNFQPNNEFVKTLRASGADFLNDLNKGIDLPIEVSRGWREMADFVEASVGKSDAEVEQELAIDWTRLFRGVSPQYGPTPPYEGAYIASGKTNSEILQAVIQFYRGSGVSAGEEYKDRLDYIGMEFSFLNHMAEAEAQAWETGDLERAQFYQDKTQEFIEEHLGLWADKYLSIAIDHAKSGFYKGFLHFCIGIFPKVAATNSTK